MLHVLVPALVAVQVGVAPAETAPPLRLERTVELADVAGRIDHLALDRKRGRLWIAALENGSVEVVDLRAGARVKHVAGLREPAGVAFAEERGRVAVGCGGGTLALFDAETLELAGAVEGLPDADNVRWDPAHDRVVVAFGEGGLALVDAKTWSVSARIELGAHPESFQLDAKGERAFVNLPAKRCVVLVDLGEKKELARVALDVAARNYPMLWSEAAHLVAIGCREPAKLVLVDAAKPAVLAAFDLGADVDDLFLDAKRGRIYAACGGGTVDVFALDATKRDDSACTRTARVETGDGARTSLFDAAEDRLFVARPKRGAIPAAVLVYAPE